MTVNEVPTRGALTSWPRREYGREVLLRRPCLATPPSSTPGQPGAVAAGPGRRQPRCFAIPLVLSQATVSGRSRSSCRPTSRPSRWGPAPGCPKLSGGAPTECAGTTSTPAVRPADDALGPRPRGGRSPREAVLGTRTREVNEFSLQGGGNDGGRCTVWVEHDHQSANRIVTGWPRTLSDARDSPARRSWYWRLALLLTLGVAGPGGGAGLPTPSTTPTSVQRGGQQTSCPHRLSTTPRSWPSWRRGC